MGAINERINNNLNSLKDTIVDYFGIIDTVYVVPHKAMDFDAIGAAAAICELSLQNNKETFIITDDDESLMEANLHKVYTSLSNRYNFINTTTLAENRRDNTRELVVIVDTNKMVRTPIYDMLPTFSNILILDHHNIESDSMQLDNSFIEPYMSSACEISLEILKRFGIIPDPELATYLYAGILLDSGKIVGNISPYLCLAVADLIHYGADKNAARNLFINSDYKREWQERKLIADLIILNNEIGIYGLTLNINEPYKLYTREILSKTADILIDECGFKASFVMGYIDRQELGEGHRNIVHISARGRDLDVSKFMCSIGGGGRAEAAAAAFVDADIFAIKKLLEDILVISLYEKETPKKLELLPCYMKKL